MNILALVFATALAGAIGYGLGLARFDARTAAMYVDQEAAAELDRQLAALLADPDPADLACDALLEAAEAALDARRSLEVEDMEALLPHK